MSYEHKSNVNPKKTPLPLKIVLVVIVMLLILYFLAPTLLSGFFTKIISPFWSIANKQGKQEQLSQAVSGEYKDAMVNELMKENEQLKSIMNRNASSSLMIAYVLKKPPFTAYDSFIIDVGKKDGVIVGDKIYAPHHILIGEVIEAEETTSKVKLYSSYGEKYEVFLGMGTSSESLQTTAVGRGGGSFEIVLPRDVKVKVGDNVIVPGLSDGVFGIVKEVIDEQPKTFSTILFSQPINIYELKLVVLYK